MIDDESEAYAGEWLIDTKRVKLLESNFHNAETYKDNACYETNALSPSDYSPINNFRGQSGIVDKDGSTKNKNDKRYSSRLPSGVMDASQCNGDAPIFVSQPYFISGNVEYFKNSIHWNNGYFNHISGIKH